MLVWRRSYDTPPPALEPADPRASYADPRYAGVPREQIPLTECLKDTVARVLPLWNESIAPDIKAGKRVVIAAHGNSIRASVKYLDQISDDDIVGLNIPNGTPRCMSSTPTCGRCATTISATVKRSPLRWPLSPAGQVALNPDGVRAPAHRRRARADRFPPPSYTVGHCGARPATEAGPIRNPLLTRSGSPHA